VTNLHVRAVVATDYSEIGEFHFDYDSLQQLAREAEGKPVYCEFQLDRPVGRVIGAAARKVAFVSPKGLESDYEDKEAGLTFAVVEARLAFYDPNRNDWYIVPQILIKGESWELMAFGLTRTPAGQYLSPVEVLDR